jgi:hypothetical protein
MVLANLIHTVIYGVRIRLWPALFILEQKKLRRRGRRTHRTNSSSIWAYMHETIHKSGESRVLERGKRLGCKAAAKIIMAGLAGKKQ